MNKKKFTANEMLANADLNQVKGGGLLSDMASAYTSAKGTPVSSSTSIARPSSVRGDRLTARTISTVSTIGTAVGASTQDTNIATSVVLAALPYFR